MLEEHHSSPGEDVKTTTSISTLGNGIKAKDNSSGNYTSKSVVKLINGILSMKLMTKFVFWKGTHMKKLISLFMSMVLLFSVGAEAFAAYPEGHTFL